MEKTFLHILVIAIYMVILVIAFNVCEIERDLNSVAHELHVYNAWHQ